MFCNMVFISIVELYTKILSIPSANVGGTYCLHIRPHTSHQFVLMSCIPSFPLAIARSIHMSNAVACGKTIQIDFARNSLASWIQCALWETSKLHLSIITLQLEFKHVFAVFRTRNLLPRTSWHNIFHHSQEYRKE